MYTYIYIRIHVRIYIYTRVCVNILYRIRRRHAKVVNHVEINTTSVAGAFSARTTHPRPTRKRKRAPPPLLENNYAPRPMTRNVRTPGSRSVSFNRNRVPITIMSLGQKITFLFVSRPRAVCNRWHFFFFIIYIPFLLHSLQTTRVYGRVHRGRNIFIVRHF